MRLFVFIVSTQLKLFIICYNKLNTIKEMFMEKVLTENTLLLSDKEYVLDNTHIYSHTHHNICSSEHKHNFYEFVIILEGSITHNIGNKIENLQLGDLRLIEPNTNHSLFYNEHSIHRDVIVPKDYFEQTCSLLNININNTSTNKIYTLSQKELSHFDSLFNSFSAEASNLKKRRCIGLSIFANLLSTIFSFATSSDLPQKSLPHCVQYLIDNINSPSFFANNTIGNLIKRTNYSPSYVSHVFKKYIGTSISDYVKERRVLHVEYYLTNTDYSIQKICEIVGLKNLSHLNKIFKEKYTISPIKYRKLNKNISNN